MCGGPLCLFFYFYVQMSEDASAKGSYPQAWTIGSDGKGYATLKITDQTLRTLMSNTGAKFIHELTTSQTLKDLMNEYPTSPLTLRTIRIFIESSHPPQTWENIKLDDIIGEAKSKENGMPLFNFVAHYKTFSIFSVTLRRLTYIEAGEDCPICFDRIQTSQGRFLSCGHGICKDCVEDYFAGHEFRECPVCRVLSYKSSKTFQRRSRRSKRKRTLHRTSRRKRARKKNT